MKNFVSLNRHNLTFFQVLSNFLTFFQNPKFFLTFVILLVVLDFPDLVATLFNTSTKTRLLLTRKTMLGKTVFKKNLTMLSVW